MLTLREATEQDREPICRLWEAAGFGRTDDHEWSALVSAPSATILLAEEDGELAGATIASYDGWRAYVYHAAVAPTFQRLGVGLALIQEAERYLSNRHARRAFVMVNAQNEPGLALSAAAGFAPAGDLVLTKELAIPMPGPG